MPGKTRFLNSHYLHSKIIINIDFIIFGHSFQDTKCPLHRMIIIDKMLSMT